MSQHSKEEFKQKMIKHFAVGSDSPLIISMMNLKNSEPIYKNEQQYICSEFGLVMNVALIPETKDCFQLQFVDKKDYTTELSKNAIELTSPTWFKDKLVEVEVLSLERNVISFRLEKSLILEEDYNYQTYYFDDGVLIPDIEFDVKTGDIEPYGSNIDDFIRSCSEDKLDKDAYFYLGLRPNPDTAEQVRNLNWNPHFPKETIEMIATVFEAENLEFDNPIFVEAMYLLKSNSLPLMVIHEKTKNT